MTESVCSVCNGLKTNLEFVHCPRAGNASGTWIESRTVGRPEKLRNSRDVACVSAARGPAILKPSREKSIESSALAGCGCDAKRSITCTPALNGLDGSDTN